MIVNSYCQSTVVCYRIALQHVSEPTLFYSSSYSYCEYQTNLWHCSLFRVNTPVIPSMYGIYNDQTHQFKLLHQSIQALPDYSTIMTYSRFMTKPVEGCECILYQPAVIDKTKTYSLIVKLHGGPHNIFNLYYTKDTLELIEENYFVLIPNYHGSFGYGDDFLYSLCHHIGSIEIEDVVDAIHYVCNHHKIINSHSIYFIGSSYGGFIGLHLLEQYPDLIKSAILRNPVVDTVTMMTTSDMHLWMLLLAGIIPYCNDHSIKTEQIIKGNYIYTEDDLKQVHSCNPYYYLNKIKTPITFILGGQDCRVVNQQTYRVYRYLKANQLDVKLYVNKNDNHFLRTVESSVLTWKAQVERFV